MRFLDNFERNTSDQSVNWDPVETARRGFLEA